jgi:hypothetical protein
MIAHAGVQRSVWHGVGRYMVVLVFDAHIFRFRRHELMAFVSLCREVILRFHQREFPRFAQLCRQAAAALGPLAPVDAVTPGAHLRDRVN